MKKMYLKQSKLHAYMYAEILKTNNFEDLGNSSEPFKNNLERLQNYSEDLGNSFDHLGNSFDHLGNCSEANIEKF